MKKIGLGILMGLLIMPIALLAQPKLDFEGGRIFDWGNVKPKDSPLKTRVKLYNKGSELLKITKVVPGCGCTVAKMDKDEIAPGDSTFVDITLNIKDNATKLTKSITFNTNVPGSEKYVYMLKANVVTGYRLNPQNINFFNVEQGKEFVSKLVLENTSDKNMTIDSITIDPNYMTTNLQKGMVIKAGETVTVECKVIPKRTENFYPRITLKLSGNPDVEKIVIYGSGRAKSMEEIMKGTNGANQLPPKPDGVKVPPTDAVKTPPTVQKPVKLETPQAPVQQNPEKK
jgi:3'-phosphoadenosine 5'-phosphosulfate sulfotransferase